MLWWLTRRSASNARVSGSRHRQGLLPPVCPEDCPTQGSTGSGKASYEECNVRAEVAPASSISLGRATPTTPRSASRERRRPFPAMSSCSSGPS